MGGSNEALLQLCTDCVIWDCASPSLWPEMNPDNFVCYYKTGEREEEVKKMLSLGNSPSYLNLSYINVCSY